MAFLFAYFLLFSWINASPIYHEYCVIGAGPAGLQTAYFLQESNRDYIVFERANKTGAFFSHYPRHRNLISVNKRFTGEINEEFNMRHDWNSLINNRNLKFTSYSDKIFPGADLLVNYLNDFSHEFYLNIQKNTQIEGINCVEFERSSHTECHSDGKIAYLRDSNKQKCSKYELYDQHGNEYNCKVLIISTGLSLPNIPENIKQVEGYESISTNPKDYEGKSVLILGRGNAAFEVAQSIYGYTNFLHLVSRSRVRNAFSTHYVGDVRAVNNDILDTYQLKTLDGFLDIDLNDIELIKKNNKFFLAPKHSGLNQQQARIGYDKVIRCLGFKFDFSIFNDSMKFSHANGRIKKYPVINADFESADWSNLYFSGTIAHSLDFRKSSGGFIHGFRYMIRTQHRLMEYRYHGIKWPKIELPLNSLLNYVLKRINEAAGTYQMFGHLVDLIVFNKNTKTFSYYEEFPLKLVHKFKWYTGWELSKEFVIINFQYGPNFSAPGNDVFKLGRATGHVPDAHKSNFLHPVLYYYKSIPQLSINENLLDYANHEHHVLEDFLTFWTDINQHQLQFRRFFEHILDLDLKNYSSDQCFEFYINYDSIPLTCEKYFI